MNLERTRSVPRRWRKASASARCPNHGSPTEIFFVYYNVEQTNKKANKETVETSNQTTHRPDLELSPTVGFEEHGLRSKWSPSPFNDVAVQLEELYEYPVLPQLTWK